jgi:hypothetical protein
MDETDFSATQLQHWMQDMLVQHVSVLGEFILTMKEGIIVDEARDNLVKTFNVDRVKLDRVWVE